MEPLDSPFIVSCLAAVASGAGVFSLMRRRPHPEAAALAVAHMATMRLLRLAASDQRNLALALLGHSQHVQPSDGVLEGLARRLLDMSEDLTQQTDMPDARRHLEEEVVEIMPVIEFAMAQVAANLGPGRRAWRLAPDLEHIRLLADRRAMNQVLVNVLSGAAASTREGDWIGLSAERGPESWCLIVQDEGIGLPVAANDQHVEESRGIGLRLTLARSLMQAHSGALTVESAERVGTRVRLSFPARRLVG
jgi:signal transduction histidine kinase